MSHSQDQQRPVFHLGNPFRMLLPNASYLSPRHLSLLKAFEETLASRLGKLNPATNEHVLRLSWLRCAMEQLSGIHADAKTLLRDLELPTSDGEEKWVELYFDETAKLLDISNSFTSQIRSLEQSCVYLDRALDQLCGPTPETFIDVCSSLDKWRHDVTSKSPPLDQCFSMMDGLSHTLDLPKLKSSEENALMQAVYGVKAVTLFVFCVLAAFLFGSVNMLMDLQVPDTYLWAETFIVLQSCVNNEIRNAFLSGKVIVVKELEAIDAGVKKLYPIMREGVDPTEAEALVSAVSEIRISSKDYSEGLLLLSKEVDNFFKALLSGRNALMDKLTVALNPVNTDKSA